MNIKTQVRHLWLRQPGSQGTYSRILSTSASESDGPVPNFAYIYASGCSLALYLMQVS